MMAIAGVFKRLNRKLGEHFDRKVTAEIPNNEVEASRLFSTAQDAYEKKQDSQSALVIFKRIQKEFPGTHWSIYAKSYIGRITGAAQRRALEPTKSKTNMRFEFTGTSREYFKIWVVNLCLTLITAGIFSA